MAEGNSPLITVLMSIFNEPEDWLRASIDSILDQTFTDFEYILINDNPERELNIRLLREYSSQDIRIKIIHNKKNIGLTKSLNIGLGESNGKYISRMDADDISLQDRLSTQFNYMEMNPGCIVCGSNMLNFNGNTEHPKAIRFPEHDEDIRLMFFFKNSISHPTAFIRSRVLRENKISYNEDVVYAQDSYLWVELLKYGSFHNLQEFLVYHRVSNQQISTALRKEQYLSSYKIRQEYFQEFLKNLKIGVPHSLREIAGLKIQAKIKRHLYAATFYFRDRLTLIDYVCMFFIYGFIRYMKLYNYVLIHKYKMLK